MILCSLGHHHLEKLKYYTNMYQGGDDVCMQKMILYKICNTNFVLTPN